MVSDQRPASRAAKAGPPPRGADRLLALDRRPPRRSGLQRLGLLLGGLLTVVCLLGAGALGYANWRFGQINRVNLRLAKAAAGTPQNYLIVGSDTRKGITRNDPNAGAFLNGPNSSDASNSRSDTIMVLRVDPRKTAAQLLSLPRDLYVPIAGTKRTDRINAAFGLGREVLTRTIENNFGIPINHYIEVDFVGFQRIVDAIGGVSMYFQVPMRDANTGLDVKTPGCISLDGTQALALARSRHLYYFQRGSWHYDGASDLSRINRQQALIRRAIPKAESQAFQNPVTLNSLADTVVHNITIDDQLSAGGLVDLANRFRHFDSAHLVTYSVPTQPITLNDGAQVLRLDASKAEATLALFRGTSQNRIPENDVHVRVLNGSGTAAQAANVGGALQRVGFDVQGMGNSGELGLGHVTHTQIRYAPGDEAAASLLARHLTTEPVLTPIKGASAGTVVLVTGSDFTTVESTARPAPTTSTTPGSTAAPTSSTTTTTSLPVWIPGAAPAGQSCG